MAVAGDPQTRKDSTQVVSSSLQGVAGEVGVGVGVGVGIGVVDGASAGGHGGGVGFSVHMS